MVYTTNAPIEPKNGQITYYNIIAFTDHIRIRAQVTEIAITKTFNLYLFSRADPWYTIELLDVFVTGCAYVSILCNLEFESYEIPIHVPKKR